MIDRLLLNNQIITNKKKIQQARTQTINKLVQKIRKFKLLNEKKPQNAKITKNLEKLPKIMTSLKKIKVADIIRKILTSTKKPTAIITNGQALPDDVAVALLAGNKILTPIIGTLRTLLNLNDSNPGWQNEIMELSKRKKKILEGGFRKRSKTLTKSKKQTLAKKLPWKEENLESTETPIDENKDTSANGWKVETANDIKKNPLSFIQQGEFLKNKPKKSTPTPKIVVSSEKHDDDSIQLTSHKPTTTVDSFFFTETGDNYLSTVVIDRAQPEPIQDGLVRRERRDNTIRPNKRNNNFRKQSTSNIGFDSKRQFIQNKAIENKQSFGSKSNIKTEVGEQLHPSWAAKQKLKPTISEFKGQKITFDDDGQNTTVKSFIKSNKKEGNHQTNKPAKEIQEVIHPSWAAKQKQKPAITEFKGIKIKFDD